MSYSRDGLSIGIERVNSTFFISIKIVGELTHNDYEIMTPMIDSAVLGLKQPKILAFVDISELDGWTMHAAWDDFKLGLRHGSEFEKIAVYGNKNWQEIVSKIGSWFVSGEIKSFTNSNDALDWLHT